MDMDDRPLLTMLVIAFNQERFIREAVEGALSQTYRPLEVLISDDRSTDRTFEIIKECVERYRGPHDVRVNRNRVNLGLGSHINRMVQLARGELHVIAAGDDVSFPERVSRTWEAYCDSGGVAMSIYSSVVIIDENGNKGGVYRRSLPEGSGGFEARLRNLDFGVSGCSHAWHRRVFEVFGPLTPGTTLEDRIIPFRSAHLGSIDYIDEPLVFYRRWSGNLDTRGSEHFPPYSFWNTMRALRPLALERPLKWVHVWDNLRRDVRVDHEAIKVSPAVRARAERAIRKAIELNEWEIRLIEGTFPQRCLTILEGLCRRPTHPTTRKWVMRLLVPALYYRAFRRKYTRLPLADLMP